MEPGSFQPQSGTASMASDGLAVSPYLPAIPDAAPTASQQRLQSSTVGEIETFADVLPEFMLLSERVSSQNLFSEPEWLDAYLRAFEPSSEVLALTARQNGRLTGLLPFVRSFEQWRGFPARILRPLANPLCHRFEVPREGGPSGTAVLRAIFSTLDRVNEWDVMELPRLLASGNTMTELLSLAHEKGWHAVTSAPTANLFVRLPLGVGKKLDAPWQSKATASQVKDLHRAEELVKSELDGWICFATIARPTAEQLRLLFELCSLGWTGPRKSAILSATRSFYTEVVRTYAKAGRLMLNFAFLQDQAVAGQISIRTGDSLCGLLSAYDERFCRYSPANLLINGMLRLCWERGIRGYEFGPDSYCKRRWTNQETLVSSYVLFRRGFYGSLLHHCTFVAPPRLRRALARLTTCSATCARGRSARNSCA